MTTELPIKSPRKLIEVALPLDAVNAAAQSEKNPFLKGHPRSIHLWWSRKPLSVARAVIFAQMVNDPGFQLGKGFRYGKNKRDAAVERERLFKIIEELVKWENINNKDVLERARAEIYRSWREVCALNKDHPNARELFNPESLPAFHDPFAGGGSIPLEAQRLGLETYAGDLNPVAVTINKAMIEIPPRFVGRPPIGPILAKEKQHYLGLEDWSGTQGISEDVRRYGAWMREEAEKRIGELYPTIKITPEMVDQRPDLKSYVGQELSIVAWIWARTVNSPNPAYSHVPVPLTSKFTLSSATGKEHYIQPYIDGDQYELIVCRGKPKEEAKLGTKSARGANFRCLLSGDPISGDYIKAEGKANRLGQKLLAVVAEGKRERVYLSADQFQEDLALAAQPRWTPNQPLPKDPRNFWTPAYGMTKFDDLFTTRQMAAMTTYSDLLREVELKVFEDSSNSFDDLDVSGIEEGGRGNRAYAEAITLYLACAVSQLARYSSNICAWNQANGNVAQAFGRQAIPMTWDFAEANPIKGPLNFTTMVDWVASAIKGADVQGYAIQEASQQQTTSLNKVVSTDPPYYDNISYADLSDFFYLWLKNGIGHFMPSVFSTIASPKSEELVATPYRHESTLAAEEFFLAGMSQSIGNVAQQSHPAFPSTIYYAFKQNEEDNDSVSNTGWDTFLTAIIESGFEITGTWPMRTEKTEGLKGNENALASSIVLVCRRRDSNAEIVSRREFIRELNTTLPEALDEMTRGGVNSPVAPVDLSQAIIGPGMAIFSKYKQVLEANGQPMSVRTALQLINRFLAEDDFDRDTQFCLSWFEQYGWGTESYGHADVLARAKGTSVDGLQQAGVVEAGGGRVRLLRWRELPTTWSPSKDARTPVWEALHQIVRVLNDRGETEAGLVLAQLSRIGEPMRALAYRLYTLCERKGWAEDARFYNEVATAWSGMERAALEASVADTRGSNMDRLDFGSTD